MKSGDYIGLYIDDRLLYTGVLKAISKMESERTVYQVLLVKNIFSATSLKFTSTRIFGLWLLSRYRLRLCDSRSTCKSILKKWRWNMSPSSSEKKSSITSSDEYNRLLQLYEED